MSGKQADQALEFIPEKWLSPEGEAVSCVEKIKVLNENIVEIRDMCREALEDAVLMGCDERQIRSVLEQLVRGLEEPFKN